MPEPPFESLYRATATLAMPSADELGSNAERRARRQRRAAALATCLAVAAVAGSVVWRDGSAPTVIYSNATPSATVAPSPSQGATSSPPNRSPSSPTTRPTRTMPASASASLTRVPSTALLAPADAAPGRWTVEGEAAGDWHLTFAIQSCPLARLDGHLGGMDTATRALTDGTRTVFQRVTLHRAGDAAPAMDWIRRNVAACQQYRAPGADTESGMRIVARDFAGDESFLVETTDASNDPGLHVFVRVGPLVAEIVPEGGSEAFARHLGQRAVDRLCAATGTC